MLKKYRLVGVALLGLLATTANTALAQLTCDRACLTGYVDSWFKGLTTNDPRAVPLANGAKLTHNGQISDLAHMFWANADSVPYRWDIVNQRLGDTGTEAVILNSDGTKTMLMLRLKVANGAITEVETIKANQGEADGLWGPDTLLERGVSKALQLSIREAERDSYYRLIAAGESYWRAFQTNGSPDYHPADLLPYSERFENGLQTTGLVRNGVFNTTAKGFDEGSFIGRNLWDRRYAVVDEERGIVLSIVRFGLKDGAESQSAATTNSRLVGEFFSVQHGLIQEVHAVLFNLAESAAPVWPADYGPGRGGAGW
jgi:hypothetical protein